MGQEGRGGERGQEGGGDRVCEPFLPNFPIPPSIFFFFFTLPVEKEGVFGISFASYLRDLEYVYLFEPQAFHL